MLTMREACRELNVHRDTMRKYLNQGLIQGTKLPGGHWRIDSDSLRRFRQNEDREKALDLMRRKRICP